MTGKALVASKEFWLNFISFILLVLALPEFISLVPVEAIPYIALITAVGNLALRTLLTSKPITGIFKR